MTAQVSTIPTNSGAVITEQSCAASGVDSIPDSCVLVVRNTGVGSHVFSIGINATFDGLAVATTGAASGVRQYTLAASAVMLIRVPASYGDVNNRCNIFADGTTAEVKYNVIGV
jgi:hypothetical protein